MPDPADPRRAELGNFLRARRERLSPQALGIAAKRPRRTPGLRREEVAELAGIGVDWYIRLEQGRDVSPSADTVDALARALCLQPQEHAHLRALAHAVLPRPAFVREQVPAELRGIVAGLNLPAYVCGRRGDILAWNAAAVDLLADFAEMPEPRRNIYLYMLTDARSRRLFGGGWAQEAQRMVALFRGSHDLWAGDAAFEALRDLLAAECEEFEAWWAAHDVRHPRAGCKWLHHPTRGLLRAEHASFQANDDPGLKLSVYTVTAADPSEVPKA